MFLVHDSTNLSSKWSQHADTNMKPRQFLGSLGWYFYIRGAHLRISPTNMSLANGFGKSLAFRRFLLLLFIVVSFIFFIGFSMPRRERRSGVAYIHDDKERDGSFFKRRSGLFKSAANLNALTGARVAIILEASNGVMLFQTNHPTMDFLGWMLNWVMMVLSRHSSIGNGECVYAQ